jgi:nitrous oxide reductase
MLKFYDITRDDYVTVTQSDVNRFVAATQAYGELVMFLSEQLKDAGDGKLAEPAEAILSNINIKLGLVREKLAQQITLADIDLPGLTDIHG